MEVCVSKLYCICICCLICMWQTLLHMNMSVYVCVLQMQPAAVVWSIKPVMGAQLKFGKYDFHNRLHIVQGHSETNRVEAKLQQVS